MVNKHWIAGVVFHKGGLFTRDCIFFVNWNILIIFDKRQINLPQDIVQNYLKK